MKLLILEDDQIVAQALLEASHPHWPGEVIWVQNCKDALFHLSGPHYIPVFFSDVVLPDGDGLNVIQVAKSRGHMAFTDTVIMTAVADKKMVMRAGLNGLKKFFVKPINPDNVSLILDSVRHSMVHMNQAAAVLANQAVEELLNQLNAIEPNNITEREIVALQKKAIDLGLATLAQAITRLRAYINLPFRKKGELDSALDALEQHIEKIKTSLRPDEPANEQADSNHAFCPLNFGGSASYEQTS